MLRGIVTIILLLLNMTLWGTAIVLVGIILTQTARANKVIDAGLAFRA